MSSSIVILNYNTSQLCIEYIERIKCYECIDNIIIVDNASTEEGIKRFENYCKLNGVTFVKAKINRGYAAGNNLGVRCAIDKFGSDIVIISNPDIIISETSIESIIERNRKDSQVAVTTGLIKNYDSNRKLRIFSAFAYRVPELSDIYWNSFIFLSRIRKKISKNPFYASEQEVIKNNECEVGCVSGCFFAMSVDAYCNIGGFDEQTFLYGEEKILGFKLKEKGYKSIVINETIIHDEDSNKKKSFLKLSKIYKYTKKSVLHYLKEYLKANKLERAVYVVFSFFRFWEDVLINLAIKKK